MEDDIIRVLNALAGLVWTALPDGQIDFANQRWCEYTGLRVERARGSGWQAAISRTIIESRGGRLWPAVNPGRGATFHFTLPTAPEA